MPTSVARCGVSGACTRRPPWARARRLAGWRGWAAWSPATPPSSSSPAPWPPTSSTPSYSSAISCARCRGHLDIYLNIYTEIILQILYLGMTTNERLNAGRYKYLRKEGKRFTSPFNLGVKRNFVNFFFGSQDALINSGPSLSSDKYGKLIV